MLPIYLSFFFFNDTATTEIYTLSLHDALPISFDVRQRPEVRREHHADHRSVCTSTESTAGRSRTIDRKSTRLNSSHTVISYAVFCLKKKKKKTKQTRPVYASEIMIERATVET